MRRPRRHPIARIIPSLRLGALLVLLAALASTPAGVRAQSTVCDAGDREVRELQFQGNRSFAARDLAAKIVTAPSTWRRRTLRVVGGTRHCLDAQELRLDRLRLQTFYRERGFYTARVDTQVTALGPEAVRVVFRIDEGQPIVIDSLVVLGVDSLAPGLRSAVVGNLPVRVGQRFDKARIDQAMDSLRARLWNEGYPRADVARSYTVDAPSRRARVELTVIPGALARLAEVRVRVEPAEGRAQQIPDRVARRLSGLHEGAIYRERDLMAAQRNLYQTNAYRHVAVRIAADSARQGGAGADSTLVVYVELQEDLMRQLDAEVGWGSLDCLRTRATYTDKNFLNGARRFDLSGQLSKIGYGYPLQSRGTRRACNDLSGGSLDEDAAFSDTLQYYVGASLQQPSLFGSRFSPAFSVYRERRGAYRAYLRTTLIGGELSAVREFARASPMRLAYSVEYGRTQAEAVVLCTVFNRCVQAEQEQLTRHVQPLAVASASLARYRTDSPTSPRRGTAARLELRTSQRLLGSADNLQFNRGFLDGIWYHPVGGDVLSARLRLGTVLGPSLSFSEPSRYIPPQERLYAGGATSVRGFQQNELGGVVYIAEHAPVQETVGGEVYYRLADRQVRRVVPTGGNSLVVANFDYRLRSPFLPELLQFAVFTDVGQVWTRNTEREYLGFKNLRWTPGVGLRVFTPVGPFQMNVAYNRYDRPAGPIFYDEPFGSRADPVTGQPLPGRLLCLSEGGIPESQQGTGSCPGTFLPERRSGFQRLTFTFSIGPEF